jgi:hypothetical protein
MQKWGLIPGHGGPGQGEPAARDLAFSLLFGPLLSADTTGSEECHDGWLMFFEQLEVGAEWAQSAKRRGCQPLSARRY